MEADVEDLQKQLMATLLPFQVCEAALNTHVLTHIDFGVGKMLCVVRNGAPDRGMPACRGHLRHCVLAQNAF